MPAVTDEGGVTDPAARRALLRLLLPEGVSGYVGRGYYGGGWRRITGHHARQLHFRSVANRTVTLLANGAGEVPGQLRVDCGRLAFVSEHEPCPTGPVVVRYRLEGGAYTFLSHVGRPDGEGLQRLEAPLLVERRDSRRSTRFDADGTDIGVELLLGDELVCARVTEASSSGLGLEGRHLPDDLREGRRLFGWLLVRGERYVQLDADLRWLVASEGRWAAGFRLSIQPEDAEAWRDLLAVLERRAWFG